MPRTLLFIGVLTLTTATAHADARSEARDGVVGCWNVGSGVTLDLTANGARGLTVTARFAERPRGGPAQQRTHARWVPSAEAFELQCRPRSQHGSFCHVRPTQSGLEVRVYTRGHGRTAAGTPSESLVATRCTPRSEPPTPAAAQNGFTWTPLTGTTLRTDIASRWGVLVDVADATRGRFESPYDRYVLTTPQCSEYCVAIARVPTRAPAPHEAIAAFVRESMGEQPSRAQTLTDGTSPTGTTFVVRRFTVRMGVPGLEGQSIHYMTEVSRFFASIPIDATSHLVCTGYVEHAVNTMDDPAMRAAADVCLSLARVP